MPRRRKLHILRFAFSGKSSVVPLLLLSPPNPLTLGFGGAPVGGPLDPRGNVLGHSDVLCANHFAMVRVTRLRRLRRSAYPLASAYCGAVEWVELTQPPNFRLQIKLVIL